MAVDKPKALKRLLAVAVGAALLLAGAQGVAAGGTPPANDDFADAQVVTLPFASGPLDLSGATQETSEPRSSCGFPSQGTIWYQVTPHNDGVLVASSSTTNSYVIIAVWTEQNGQLAQVGCSLTSPARVTAVVEAARTYYVQMGTSYSDPTVPVNITIVERERLANDNFANATAISAVPFSTSLNTDAATTELGEPRTCGGGKYYAESASTVWYSFTPSRDMLAVVDTTGSDYDTVIGVWTEGQFGLNQVACATGAVYQEPRAARLAFDAHAGTTYYLQLGGVPYAVSYGYLNLTVSAGVPPANDDYANAENVTSFPFDDAVDTLAATREASEPTPTCAPLGLDATAWYRVRLDQDALITVEAGQGTQATAIAVYHGPSMANTRQVACSQPYYYPTSTLAFEAHAGEAYYVQVGTVSTSGPPIFESAAGQGGGMTVRMTSRPLPACPPPDVSFQDTPGDAHIWFQPADPNRQPDIRSVGVGETSQDLCLTFDFAQPVSGPDSNADGAITGSVFLDTDANRNTGWGTNQCGFDRQLGIEAEVDLQSGFGLLAPIYQYYANPTPESPQFALTLFDGHTLTLLIPRAVTGGSDTLSFVARVAGVSSGAEDCAPDSGILRVPPPPFGDANCDGAVDAQDAVIILQFFARLLPSLPCGYVADANGNGTIGSIDASLILQYTAGLIDSLPGASRSAVDAAIRATAEQMGIPESDVVLNSKEAMTWPDGCLGLGQPGEACTQATVPGYQITVTGYYGGLPGPTPPPPPGFDFQKFLWRTNLNGSVLRVEAIAVP